MSEDAAAVEVAPAAVDPAATNGEADGEKKKKFERKRDETPIEELFDLTKPIPRVEKPDKVAFEKELGEIQAAMDALKEERKKIQDSIDAAMADPESKAQLQTARNKMNELKAKKTALIEEKKAMRGKLDQAKTKTDKIIKDKKDARSNVKYNSLDQINDEIKKLQRKQETTTMSLQEEKKLIKEMDALEASKKYVADLKNKDAAMDNIKEERKSIQQQIQAKDKEIDNYTKEIDNVMQVIKDINEKETTKRNSIQEKFKARNEISKKMKEKIEEKDALRADFRVKNDAFYNVQRAVRAQKKIQWEEERERREKEKAEWEAKIAAEEAKKIPYEEEQHLCEYLADYLERTYLGKDDKKDGGDKKPDVVAVKEDPFAGAQPLKKKDDDEFFSKGKGKKKRVRGAKKQDSAAGPFTLSVDSFEQFGLLQLNPPTKIEEVEGAVKALKEKKEWYSKQPRGSVPTAQEIRKANEKAAQKVRASVDRESSAAATASAAGPKKGGGGAFKLSSDDFAPLGASSTAAGNGASWGQKPASTAATDGES